MRPDRTLRKTPQHVTAKRKCTLLDEKDERNVSDFLVTSSAKGNLDNLVILKQRFIRYAFRPTILQPSSDAYNTFIRQLQFSSNSYKKGGHLQHAECDLTAWSVTIN
ncbi:hypothetical protein RP20_CCG004847 [Aedes albopictus]|nr:hypothetical protein RP20_CCG004847 [Aedes albopictus]